MNGHPIGVFDSGYGGLTILKDIRERLPKYDYQYLGDNARTPYGSRSYHTVYAYTKECVKWLFDQGCPLVIIACNTASAKALRTIQQRDLPHWGTTNRVLGVIRPTAEVIGYYSRSGHIGILATRGTVHSESYLLEIAKFFPELKVFQQACPMWVPLIENHEYDHEAGHYFIQKYLAALLQLSPDIDTLLLACTHYPILYPIIKTLVPENIKVVSQGPLIADALENYLLRHPEMETRCSKTGNAQFFTTDAPADFENHAALFFGENISCRQIDLTGNTG